MKKTFDVRDEIFLLSFGELRLNRRNETKKFNIVSIAAGYELRHLLPDRSPSCES